MTIYLDDNIARHEQLHQQYRMLIENPTFKHHRNYYTNIPLKDQLFDMYLCANVYLTTLMATHQDKNVYFDFFNNHVMQLDGIEYTVHIRAFLDDLLSNRENDSLL